ncbi:universal stress protein [Chitinispirillales bacterium ANBcel5]|uniref:universal stress protein n=1 Tax=Cellulosispirillum alkaliphilum TaxID=3039283 RepID=UPI002A58B24F|nr:universal stress protein [Chitinispirillales bacterium ANBcel5]
MFSRGIIATDLSEASKKLVQCARGLKPLGTRDILLLQCVRNMEATSLALSESNEVLQNILEEQKSILVEEGFSTSTEVAFGTPHNEINRIAHEQNYSFIMVGSHGHTLSRDILLGSVASEVIQSAKKPTFVVRITPKKSDNPDADERIDICDDFHSSILFPTDFSQTADTAFTYVEDMVKSGARSVTIMHVQDRIKLDKHSKKMLEEFDEIDRSRLNELKTRLLNINNGVIVNSKITYNKPSQDILAAAEKINPSIIVMGTHGRGYVQEVFMGSVSHTVTRNAKTSLLLVPLGA